MPVLPRVAATLGLVAGATLLPEALEAAERYRSLTGSSTRVDVSYAFFLPDLDGQNDFASSLTVEVLYQSRLGMSSFDNWGVVWGMGVTGTTQSLDENGVEADFIGGSVRYHLGMTYGLTDTWHLQFVPYGGVGYGQMDLQLPFTESDDSSGFGEFGLQCHAIYSQPESFEFGAGLSFQGRITDYDFDNPFQPFRVHNEQYYLALNLTGGWRF